MLVPIIFGKFISKYKKDFFSDSMIVFTNKLKDILNGYEIIKPLAYRKKIYSKYNNSNENVENAKYKFKSKFISKLYIYGNNIFNLFHFTWI